MIVGRRRSTGTFSAVVSMERTLWTRRAHQYPSGPPPGWVWPHPARRRPNGRKATFRTPGVLKVAFLPRAGGRRGRAGGGGRWAGSVGGAALGEALRAVGPRGVGRAAGAAGQGVRGQHGRRAHP